METLADCLLTAVALALLACVGVAAVVFALGTAISQWCAE